MGVIKLGSRNNLPAGHYEFRIDGCEDKTEFDKIIFSLSTQDGLKRRETLNTKVNGKENNIAFWEFEMIAKAAMDDEDLEEIDTAALVGKFFACDVEDVPSKDGTKTFSNINIKSISATIGWGTPAPAAEAPASTASSELDDILAGL